MGGCTWVCSCVYKCVPGSESEAIAPSWGPCLHCPAGWPGAPGCHLLSQPQSLPGTRRVAQGCGDERYWLGEGSYQFALAPTTACLAHQDGGVQEGRGFPDWLPPEAAASRARSGTLAGRWWPGSPL